MGAGKWLYAHNADFSIWEANKVQVARMCEAFASILGSIRLLSFGNEEGKIRKTYQIGSQVSMTLLKPGVSPLIRSLKLARSCIVMRNLFTHIYTRDPVVTCLVKKFIPIKKLIYELHTIPTKKSRRVLLKCALKLADEVIVISNGIKSELSGFRIHLDKVHVLPDAVGLNSFTGVSEVARDDAFRDKKVIMYLGSFKAWKGVDTFLLSSLRFKENPKVIFAVVGGTKNEIDQASEKYPWVYFAGHVEYDLVPVYLARADVLVLPNSARFEISRNHTSPLKLFEYMATRKPIVASNLPSIREVVSDEDVAFFSPDDSQDLAQKIDFLLKNRAFCEKIVEHAYKKVKNNTWEARVQNVINMV